MLLKNEFGRQNQHQVHRQDRLTCREKHKVECLIKYDGRHSGTALDVIDVGVDGSAGGATLSGLEEEGM